MLIRLSSLSFVLVCLLSISADARGQLPTTVQLPSISSFSYNGTVVVPDSGTGFLGGVKRAATGSSRRGLSRGFGQDLGNSQATVRPRIIDNAEIDRQILGGTPQEFVRREQAKAQNAQGQNNRAIDPDLEGKSLVRYARREYKAGNQSAAFAGYQMAIETLQSQWLRQLASAEFKRAFGSAADQIIRMSSTRRRF